MNLGYCRWNWGVCWWWKIDIKYGWNDELSKATANTNYKPLPELCSWWWWLSTHCLSLLILHSGLERPRMYPSYFKAKVGYTLDKSSVYRRAMVFIIILSLISSSSSSSLLLILVVLVVVVGEGGGGGEQQQQQGCRNLLSSVIRCWQFIFFCM